MEKFDIRDQDSYSVFEKIFENNILKYSSIKLKELDFYLISN